VLRLPPHEVLLPETLEEALALLAEHGERAMILAGGTDLLPNMKHRLFEPEVLVALGRVAGLRGIRERDGGLEIGAMTTLTEVAGSPLVRERAPALAQAAGLVSGPQLRNMGTLGGNVMLDTRCQWYNQTFFWRQALGFCLKKDGTKCHVVEGGQKCVAAASNDTVPALMSLGAEVAVATAAGARREAVDALWRPDGIWNKKLAPGELLTAVHVPAQAPGHRGAYGKLRDRGSIDFPLLGAAARIDLDADGAVGDADLCFVALQARPTRVRRVAELLAGTVPGEATFDAALEAAAAAAAKQCKPLDNIPGDAEYRQLMVPVLARRTLRAAAEGATVGAL
jgi:4-hydroxybenzoyl-CoA reductase subunit beta